MRSQVIPVRVRIFFSLFIAFAVLMVAKLYFLQIVSGEAYSTRADRQYVVPDSNTLERGTIYFTTKTGDVVTAASQETGFLVAINPSILQNPQEAFKKLENIFHGTVSDSETIGRRFTIDEQTFFAKASKKADPYEEIAKKVPLSIGTQINALDIDGLRAYKEKWRTYPSGTLASHVLGFMAFKENELAGRYGLERQYQKTLERSGDSLYANFFVETFLNIKQSVSGDESAEGDVVTSIEPTVQSYLEQEVKKVNDTWSSEYTGGIVIDPHTGDIVAMALYPGFNPNSFQEEESPTVYSNRLVENVYEMGSIIKPITMAAALDSGVVTPKTTYFDAGTLTLNGRQIYNFDKKGRGTVDMQEVLNKSLNTGVTFAALKMGNANFANYMKRFGLAEKTGIDLPYEAAPLVNNLDTGRDIETATASFGQGIAMTPIATVRALSALANGGVLVKPRIVKQIKYKTGLSKTIEPEFGARVIKEETSTEISRMLVNVVDTALLDGKVKQERYSIAAKTGTAQIALPGARGYYEDRYLHSFFGYFPAYDARFLVFLYTYHPKGVQYASETLTKTFIDITKYLINYYEIDPDR